MVSHKRTLCKRCVNDYKTAGFHPVPANFQSVKSPCDICSRPGFTYILSERRQEKP